MLLLLEDLGGGTGNHLCRMVGEWSARGWQVTIVTQTPPLVRQLPPGVDVRVMSPGGWYDRFPLAQVRRLLQLRQIVRDVRPDMVHTYFFWSIVYGRILKLLGDVPIIAENREDMGFSWGRGAYAVLRLTRRVPDRVFCVAEAVRDVAVRRERVDRSRTTVVRNGIEVASHAPLDRDAIRRQFGFSPDHIVIGMIANLPRAVKGGTRLLDAVGPIVAALPEARFLLVGLGTDVRQLTPELEARGIASFVLGAGYRRDVEPCYAAMDVSVLTSSTEGLSITLLESMRVGLPTVVTRVGGNAEVVVDGETGFLVPLDDPAAFVERVVRLAKDPALRQRMGVAGRRRVEANFAIDGVSSRYLGEYESLLGRARLHAGTPHGSFTGMERNA